MSIPAVATMYDKFLSYQGCVASDGGRKVTGCPARAPGERRQQK